MIDVRGVLNSALTVSHPNISYFNASSLSYVELSRLELKAKCVLQIPSISQIGQINDFHVMI